ncbi:hypothetical protein OB955_18860 [Halobacteria archaeon AArc-m2/3/4]|uniref:PRC-barrel domain-containing protein n=1 Tax=Natronoglomus mannanivorans TaxID=2979990 RepID=A0ABT2QIP6_9EURY|nr:hypothetical protein [Halobacteria archaeon AArc-m2/3/4]
MSPTFTDDDIGKTVENANGEEVGVVAAIDGDTAHVDPDPGITDSIKAALGWENDPEETLALQASSVTEITRDVVYLEGESPDQRAMDTGPDTETRRTDDTAGMDTGRSVSPSTGEGESQTGTETDPAEEMGGADEMHPTEEMDGADDFETTEEMDGSDEMDTVEEMDPVEGRDRGAEIDPTELEGTDPDSSPGTGSDDTHRTDAEVEPDDDTRRTDAEIEPEGDVRRSDAELDPEAIREKATKTRSERETVDTDEESDDWDRMEDDDSSEESRDDTGDGRDSDHTVTKDRSREDN